MKAKLVKHKRAKDIILKGPSSPQSTQCSRKVRILKARVAKHKSAKDEVDTRPCDPLCAPSLRMIYGIPMRPPSSIHLRGDNAAIS